MRTSSVKLPSLLQDVIVEITELLDMISNKSILPRPSEDFGIEVIVPEQIRVHCTGISSRRMNSKPRQEDRFSRSLEVCQYHVAVEVIYSLVVAIAALQDKRSFCFVQGNSFFDGRSFRLNKSNTANVAQKADKRFLWPILLAMMWKHFKK